MSQETGEIDLSYDISEFTKSGLYDSEGNLIIVPFINDGDGCSYWRIRKPFEAMGLNLADDNKTLEQHLSTCKLVTYNRIPGLDIKKFLEMKVKYGFKVVIDWDDFWHLPHDHLIYKSWHGNRIPEISEETLKTVADYVTCTTPRLAEKIKPFNKNVYVIPNAIPLHEAQWNSEGKVYGGEHTRTLTKSGRVVDNFGARFGYVAGSSHLPDLKHFAPVLNHFPTLNFKLCGYNNPQEKVGGKNVWDQMEHIASFGYHNPNYKRVKTMEFEKYATAYDFIDVAIAPLKTNTFNTFKSSLKAYEAGAKRCAFISSRTAPYTDDVPEDCVTFCDKNWEWVDAIKAHKDLSYTEDKAAKLRAWVEENRDIKKISKDRLELYHSLI